MDATVGPYKTALMNKSKTNRINHSDSISENVSKISSESTLSHIFQLELSKFCPRKLFYIFLAVESDDESTTLIDDLVKVGNEYEDISSLTFISRADVLALLNPLNNDFVFPNPLQPLLLNVIESIKDQGEGDITLIMEAQLLKLKLVQIMYQQYADQIKRNEKARNLDNLLNILSKECKRKTRKDVSSRNEDEGKSKDPVKDDTKNLKKNKNDDKANKQVCDEEEMDYTSFPVSQDDISYEENIFDYIWFYCIKGYYNVDFIKNLIEQVDVPICGVIEISDSKNNNQIRSLTLKLFWDNIGTYFFKNTTLYKSLENTILMQFVPSDISNNDKKSSLVALEEFLFMLRKFIKVKLTHLGYLKHLKLNNIRHCYKTMPVECLQQYCTSLRYMPLECISTELVLDAILKEVCNNVKTNELSNTHISRSLKGETSLNQLINCNTRQRASSHLNTNSSSFLVHENDAIMKMLKSYKYVGPKIADTLIRLLNVLPIFDGIKGPEIRSEDIIHLHDVSPSGYLQPTENESLDHFMYIFLFNKFSSKIPELTPTAHYDLMNNLITFDSTEFSNKIQPISEEENIDSDENIYDTSVVHFRWKECISRELLFQEVFTAFNEFSYVDRKYSPETDNFLAAFSDKLDEFGINTKMVDIVIRTPICLRDFCRYTVAQESSWLRDNMINIDETTFKVVFNENCPGAQKVKKHLNMFSEYSYLLEENIIEEIKENSTEIVGDKDAITGEESLQKITFSDTLRDLEKCTPNMNIIQECGNDTDSIKNIAYDLGTNLFKVTGKVTTFCSHDGVKITLDNTGLLQLPEKCTFNVISGENVLTLHCRESVASQPYAVTLRLKDESRISLISNKHNTTPKHDSTLDPTRNENAEEPNTVTPDSAVINKLEHNIDTDQQELEPTVDNIVRCVDEDYIKQILGGKLLNELSVNENYQDLLESVLNARECNGTIYKIIASPNCIKSVNNLEISLQDVFENDIPLFDCNANEYQTPFQTYTQRFGRNEDNKSDLEINCPVDIRICLPNGLFIKPHSCVVDKKMLMIKQEFIERKPDLPAIRHEEFRLFSSQGLILIKKIDGTITIFKANGDIINFEKPCDGSGQDNAANLCDYSTFDNYRKKLNKLLKDQDTCSFATSRRGHITSKQNHIFDGKVLKILEQFDVPYFKKTVTKFDGQRIKVQGEKISQKQLYHLTSQQDFFTGEIYFERNDDLRSKFDRSGSQEIIFPDGTVISNSIDAAEELVDDFVFVKLSYQYEHPYYATVRYDFDKRSEIKLSNEVTIKENVDRNGFTVEMEDLLSASVSDENIVIQKICTDCQGQFQAYFNTKPFREGSWNPTSQFLHVTDSYGKHFYSDYLGNCSRNSDYIRGTVNSKNCNHFVKTTYKKLFVINRDFTGDKFCTNDSVKTKIKNMEILTNASVSTYYMASNENITMVDCRRKFFVAYSNRFYNNSLNQMSNLFKKTTILKREHYTTFRVFHKMFQTADEIAKHVSNMQEVFFSEFLDYLGDSSVYDNISKLTNALELYYRKYQKELLLEAKESSEKKRRQAEELERIKEHLKCPCNKTKLTMEEKILQWRKACKKYRKRIRNKEIPVYFKSEFCEILE